MGNCHSLNSLKGGYIGDYYRVCTGDSWGAFPFLARIMMPVVRTSRPLISKLLPVCASFYAHKRGQSKNQLARPEFQVRKLGAIAAAIAATQQE